MQIFQENFFFMHNGIQFFLNINHNKIWVFHGETPPPNLKWFIVFQSVISLGVRTKATEENVIVSGKEISSK